MADTSIPIPRRRGRAYVTQNACRECKKKKTKCDGNNPCGRCESNGGTTCHYDEPVNVSKENLRTTIRELRNYQQMSEDVFACLASGDRHGPILQDLQDGNTLDSIWGKLNESIPDGQSPLHAEQNKDDVKWTNDVAENTRQDTDEEQDGGPWTRVTSDAVYIEHLLSLYFCWEYPIFATLSRQHFLADFRAMRRRHCSSLLVNAVLAIGYLFSGLPETGASTDTNRHACEQQLFGEAERLLAREDRIARLTTVQALGIMSIFELSRGNQSQSIFYSGESIRMAVEMGLHRDTKNPEFSQSEREVRSATVWGAFSLDNAWCIIAGRVPYLSRRGILIPKGAFPEAEEQTTWLPYTGQELHPERSKLQTSHVRSVHVVMCELCEAVHEALYVLYVPGIVLTSKHILQIYHRYLTWYDSVPEAFRLGENYTPAVIFMHIYYQFAVLTLLGPFLKLRLLGSSFRPQEICLQAAETIKVLLASFRRLYSLRRVPSFVPLITLSSHLIYVMQEDSLEVGVSTQLSQGISDLQEMGFSHKEAVRGGQVLAAVRANMPISPAEKAALTGNVEDICKHIDVAIKLFGLEKEHCYFAGQNCFMNSIFSPFPFQVLPSLKFKKKLDLAGFGLIDDEDGIQ